MTNMAQRWGSGRLWLCPGQEEGMFWESWRGQEATAMMGWWEESSGGCGRGEETSMEREQQIV